MSQITNKGGTAPSVANSYVTDSGTAVPALNILNVLGSSGISTSGSGNTVTLTLTGVALSYVNVTFGMSPYTVTATDYYISCDSSGGPITILLPNAPTTYDEYIIKDRTGNALTNNITVTTVGGVVTIDGVATYVFDENYESIEMIFNGSTYEIF